MVERRLGKILQGQNRLTDAAHAEGVTARQGLERLGGRCEV